VTSCVFKLTAQASSQDIQQIMRSKSPLAVRKSLAFCSSGDSSWQFPQAESSAGETMRQTAERALKETIQEGPKTYFVGNAPMGHVDQNSSKAFFHKAQLIKGQAALKQGGQAVEYAWVAKDEMPKYINDQETQTLLSKMLGR
jgi:large subunit ribosomal protein L46